MNHFEGVKQSIHDCPDHAWGWQCNLAMSIYDGGQGIISREAANRLAARQMQHLFQYDITTYDHYRRVVGEPTVAEEREEELKEASRQLAHAFPGIWSEDGQLDIIALCNGGGRVVEGYVRDESGARNLKLVYTDVIPKVLSHLQLTLEDCKPLMR